MLYCRKDCKEFFLCCVIMKQKNFYMLPEPATKYLTYVSVVKGHSDATVEQYANDLSLFFRYMVRFKKIYPVSVPDEEIDLSKLDLDFFKSISLSDVYQYAIYLKTVRKNNEATRKRRLIVVKRFWAYLTDNLMILPQNKLAMLETPKLKKSKPKYLTADEATSLLRAVDGKNKERDFAILVLFLNCGMRLSELISIDYNHIKSDNTLIITGKGNKERTVYLNETCIRAIEQYMKVRPNDGVKDKALFLSNRNQRISPRSVEVMVEKYLKKAGLDGRGLSVHKLRHTAATLMYQYGGADVLQLKEILGHENLSTTEIYTHINNKTVKETVDNNPMNILKE